MDFTLPISSKKRLDELLTYLAQPCENYPGNRAEDFKEMVDVDSEWAWKYADLMMRGLESRSMPYAERHHMVPFSWYQMNEYTGARTSQYVCENNISMLGYAEHVYAHFCLTKCSSGQFKKKMCGTVASMYGMERTGHGKQKRAPGDDEIIDAISQAELVRIKVMSEKSEKLAAEGRPHFWEVETSEYYKAYREAHKDELKKKSSVYKEKNKAKILANKKRYYEENKEDISIARKASYEHRKDSINEQRRKNYSQVRDKLLAEQKKYRDANRDKISAHQKVYRAANKDKIAARDKAYRQANKEHFDTYHANYRKEHREDNISYQKAYRDTHKEELKAKKKEYLAKKKAMGMKHLKNPVTGKWGWVFVGRPEMKCNEQQLAATGT